MIKNIIRKIIEEALNRFKKTGAIPHDFKLPVVEIMEPKNKNFGDYSTNIAMIIANIGKTKGIKVNSRQFAESFSCYLPSNRFFDSVEIAGPGFINIRLNKKWIQQQLLHIINKKDKFGYKKENGQYWQIEYVSANPTGPLHFGAARNAVLGDTLANVLKAEGYNVQREYYINDVGSQFSLFVESLYARYNQLFGRNINIPQQGYHGGYMFSYASKIKKKKGKYFLGIDKKKALQELSPIALKMVLAEISDDLSEINIHFDSWFSEQSLYNDGLFDKLLEYLKIKGDIVEKDNATWFLTSKYPGNQKDDVIIRENGIPTYFASDIAYHYDKFKRRQFDKVINVWAVDHHGHVPRMDAIMRALSLNPDKLSILLYNLVKLNHSGEDIKMSKRSGKFITLKELVRKIGSDAIRFMLLTYNSEQEMNFDIAKVMNKDNKNPVYYVQYSHARATSIINKFNKNYILKVEENRNLLNLLNHPAEIKLIKQMLDFDDQIKKVIENLSPNILTSFAVNLASHFNSFYRDCKVIDANNEDLMKARVLLCIAFRIVIARVFALIGISAPEKM